MGTIDIPVSTNKFATDCIAFVRLVKPRYHAVFAGRLNGLVIFHSIKISIRLGRHPPKLIAPAYLPGLEKPIYIPPKAPATKTRYNSRLNPRTQAPPNRYNSRSKPSRQAPPNRYNSRSNPNRQAPPNRYNSPTKPSRQTRNQVTNLIPMTHRQTRTKKLAQISMNYVAWMTPDK